MILTEVITSPAITRTTHNQKKIYNSFRIHYTKEL
jgi:hypothetical protein